MDFGAPEGQGSGWAGPGPGPFVSKNMQKRGTVSILAKQTPKRFCKNTTPKRLIYRSEGFQEAVRGRTAVLCSSCVRDVTLPLQCTCQLHAD